MDKFTWEGEPIPEVRVWAAARGEKMIHYRAMRRSVNLWTGVVEKEIHRGEMPESFWNNLLSIHPHFIEAEWEAEDRVS